MKDSNTDQFEGSEKEFFGSDSPAPTEAPVSPEPVSPVPTGVQEDTLSEDQEAPASLISKETQERAWIKQQNVTQPKPMFEKLTPEQFGKGEQVALPPADPETMIKASVVTDRQGAYDPDWYASVAEAQQYQYDAGEFRDGLEDPKRKWSNTLDVDGKSYFPHRLSAPSFGENITGDRALMFVNSHLGLGTPVRIPFYNSGFWLTVRTPLEPTLLSLLRNLSESRVTLGRSTYAMSFSNNMLHTVEEVYNVLESHISNSTLADNKDLLDVISINDIPTMMLALASAMYPNGFDYSRPCIADPSKCQHVTTGRLLVNRTLQVDSSRLNEAQMRHMANISKRWCSKEAALGYQKQFQASSKRVITLTSVAGLRLRVTLKAPSLRAYLESARDWASMIENAANTALGLDSSVKEKNDYMSDVAASINMRSLSHWVETVEVVTDTTSETSPITDRDGIEKITAHSITRDTELTRGLIEGVRDFAADTTVAIVGISNYVCEKCNSSQFDVRDAEGNVVETPAIISLDISTTFFSLLRQRASLIRARV